MIRYVKQVLYVGALIFATILDMGAIEGAIWPVASVKHTVVSHGKNVCIQTELTRYRAGSAISISWTAVSKTGGRSFLSVFRPSGELAESLSRNAEAGEHRDYINCHVRPPSFGGEAYKVFLFIRYDVGHPFWDVLREDPPIIIPALSGS